MKTEENFKINRTAAQHWSGLPILLWNRPRQTNYLKFSPRGGVVFEPTDFFCGRWIHWTLPNWPQESQYYAVRVCANQFFRDKAKDMNYLRRWKLRTDGEGVTSSINSCADGERNALYSRTFRRAEKKQWKITIKYGLRAAKFPSMSMLFVSEFLTAVTLFHHKALRKQRAINVCSLGLPTSSASCRWFRHRRNHREFNGAFLPAMGRYGSPEMNQTNCSWSGLERYPDFGNFVRNREGGEGIATDCLPGVNWADACRKSFRCSPR